MTEEQIFEDLSPADVYRTAEALRADGYRMVQICGVTREGSTEVLYSFDRDHRLANYWAAFVYENEVHDLFGVEFEDSKLDYKGNFFRMSAKTPWKGPEKEVS